MWVISLAIPCLILMCLTARDGITNLYDRWSYEEEYGYAFLIVALVPFLFWRRWNALAASSVGPRWPGLSLVVVAQLCTFFAGLGESYFIEQISLIVSFLGVGLLVFSSKAIRTLLPLALLLILTVPLPYTLQAILTIKLQLLSTDIGVALIRLTDIPVYVEGNIIDLGVYKLQVAEACSGLRYLLPLLCMSFLIAYLYKAPFWKKAVVFISAPPLTILINSFRIATTALLVNSFGIRMAEGFLHEFEGWLVFLMGVLLLMIEILALERFRWSNVKIDSIMARSSASKRAMNLGNVATPLILAILVCVVTFGVTNSIALAYKSTPLPSRETFSDFPRHIGNWNGRPSSLDVDTINLLKATDTYNGDFTESPRQPAVNLFVAYYDSLSKSAAIHSPRVCLPGSGWEFASFEERKFSDLMPGALGTYYYVVIQKGEQKMLMYYWYQQRERRTANEFSMKYYVLVDGLFKSRKDGALIRLLTPVVTAAGERGEEEANARLRDFAQGATSKMRSYLPQ
jgi:exosortase D (VPLPA-CTERM-specific)